MTFSQQLKFEELKHIFIRNVFLLTNGIIFSVVALLFMFGQFRAGIFLGIISLGNILVGLTQDLNAWRNLDKLQLLTAPRVTRINPDDTEQAVLTEEILVADIIKLKIGDQVPCDGTLISALGLEINTGLITGESTSFLKQKGDTLLAGSIITAGSGSLKIKTVYHESRISRMTSGIQRHSLKSSSIQQAANLVVKYFGYALVLAIIFVIIRGLIMKTPVVSMALDIGTLASMFVPQGLVFTVTLFFAYGAANLYRKHVLLQEINATEKLGRIKNLCLDKTGTLTENILTVGSMQLPPHIDAQYAAALMLSYIQGTGDVSEITQSLKRYLEHAQPLPVLAVQPFSSWRQYGAVRVNQEGKALNIFFGSPDAFLTNLPKGKSALWLKALLLKHQHDGAHILCLMQAPGKLLPKTLTAVKLSAVAVFIFQNKIREGIPETIDFFQKRGVRIRLISGDNPETVSAVAAKVGIKDHRKIITGQEMLSWSKQVYAKQVSNYTIFARILPEQKEQIISALKQSGFTAMVGDGANDALAIKQADLGIAMFAGAPATRQLASIVLLNNSFTALPKGVQLADDVISNVEIFASIFLNQTLIGCFLFLLLSIFGRAYPLTPFNVTLINYFTIDLAGLLISYWTLRPRESVPQVSAKPFIKRVLPFALWSAVLQTLGIGLIYLINEWLLKITPVNTLILLQFIILGFAFLIFAPEVYQGKVSRRKKRQIYIMAPVGALVLWIFFQIPFLREFFNISILNVTPLSSLLISFISICFCFFQYLLAQRFIILNHKNHE